MPPHQAADLSTLSPPYDAPETCTYGEPPLPPPGALWLEAGVFTPPSAPVGAAPAPMDSVVDGADDDASGDGSVNPAFLAHVDTSSVWMAGVGC